MRTVTLYHARGCSLCDRARTQLLRAREQVPFTFEEVDVTGVPDLEARYREWLPVVEIDGKRAFVYYVDERQLLHKVATE